MKKKRILAIHGRHNHPGRKDVTHAFQPEAERLIDLYGAKGSKIVTFDNRMAFRKRGQAFLESLKQYEADISQTFEAWAIFCHGWQQGCQLGFTRATAEELARQIALLAPMTTKVTVALYLCSTGAGRANGAVSFADALRDSLCEEGLDQCRIMAHSTVGHTTRNPHALFFDGMGSPVGGAGGYPVVGRGSKLWRAWVKEMRSKESDFRFRFPFMTVGSIHRYLLPY